MNKTKARNIWNKAVRDGDLSRCRHYIRHYFRRRAMMLEELEEVLLNLEKCPTTDGEKRRLVNLITNELRNENESLTTIRHITGVECPTNDSNGADSETIAEPRDLYSYRFYGGETANPFDENDDFTRFTFWNYEHALATAPALQWVARYLFDNTCPCDWPTFIKDAKADAPAREIALMMYEDFNRHKRGEAAREKMAYDCFGVEGKCIEWNLYFDEDVKHD